MQAEKCVLVRRDNGEKSETSVQDSAALLSVVSELLNTIQTGLLTSARAARDDKIVQVLKWDDFVPAIERKCMVLTPFCDEKEWEEKVKVRII
jgi:prolyl-tRNA synthetase